MAADEEILVTIKVDTEEAGKSLKQLRGEYKQQLSDLEGLTVGTSEYVKQLKKIGATKDEIGDLNDTIKAFNPDAKMKAFGSVMGGMASGIQGAVGAMALFGVKSSETEKMLLKVQAASAFAEGINGIVGMADSFKNLGMQLGQFGIIQKVVTAGQWLWNAAMTANPIGLLVAGIAALIAGITGLVYWFNSSSEAADAQAKANTNATESLKANSKALKEQEQSAKDSSEALKVNNEHAYNMAKASGASSEALRKLSIQQANASITLAEYNALQAENTFQTTKNQLAKDALLGVDEEILKKEEAALGEALKNYIAQGDLVIKAYADKKAVINRNEEQIAQEETDRKLKAIEKQKAIDAKALEDKKKADEFQAKYNQSIQDGEQNARIEARDKEKEREVNAAKQDLIDFQASIEQTRNDERNNTDVIFEYKRTAAEKFRDFDIKLASDSAQSLQNLSDAVFSIRLANVKKGSKEEEKVLRQQFKLNKAMQMSVAVINGVQAIQSILAQYPKFDGGFAMASALVATGSASIANIAKIAATQFAGGGGSDGGSGGEGGGGEAPTAFAPPTINAPSSSNTQLNADGTVKSSGGQVTNRVIVVESDITSKQRQVAMMEQNASV